MQVPKIPHDACSDMSGCQHSTRSIPDTFHDLLEFEALQGSNLMRSYGPLHMPMRGRPLFIAPEIVMSASLSLW